MNTFGLTLFRWWLTYVLTSAVSNADERHHEYMNEWAVRIPAGDVQSVATEHGYDLVRKVRGFDDVYLLRKSDVGSRAKRESVHHTRDLVNDDRIEWAEQQIAKRRDKRDLQCNQFNDPQWCYQWYLRPNKQCGVLIIDLNVEKAWLSGYTGKNVTITIIDDGIEWNHTDLYPNYDSRASYDLNDHDNDPMPRYDLYGTNRHGTKCAGEVAMVANNSKCGVGVAYESNIGGIRMLDGPVTDTLEGEAVGFNCDHIDIFSASWGPTDDGQTMDGPGRMTSAAIERCVKTGRGGLGALYIWASGNGGISGDHCGCDGYINSIYTIAINSVSESGYLPWYGELCAATMAVTNSGGSFQDHKISTVDLQNTCSNSFSGTSAAAPLAAGAFALVLQANRKLTWRDCQHILVCTCETYHILNNNDGWQRNGVNLVFNHKFGFGVVNVHRMTQVAANWTNVGPQISCPIQFHPFYPQRIGWSSRQKIELIFNGDSCAGRGPDKVNYLEHVQVVLTMDYSRRGAIQVKLQSPSNTISYLLNARVADKSTAGIKNWTFMSVHYWGESPYGTWILSIFDETKEMNEGHVINAELIMLGTHERPEHRKYGATCGISKQFQDVNETCEKSSEKSFSWSETFQNFINLFTGS